MGKQQRNKCRNQHSVGCLTLYISFPPLDSIYFKDSPSSLHHPLTVSEPRRRMQLSKISLRTSCLVVSLWPYTMRRGDSNDSKYFICILHLINESHQSFFFRLCPKSHTKKIYIKLRLADVRAPQPPVCTASQ